MVKTTCDKLEVIVRKIKDCKYKSELTLLWKEFFTIYLKSQGFNKKAINKLFEWGDGGHNWVELHQENSEYYGKFGRVRLSQSFKGEVNYIYDRMSLDRLFRAHWIYNQYVIKATYQKENNHE
jgi:hypothetical protein